MPTPTPKKQFFMVPASLPNAQIINQELYYLQVTPPAALLNQVKLAYKGVDYGGAVEFDPLVGFIIPGTNLKWEDLTEVQKAIFNTAAEGNSAADPEMLIGMPGPQVQWNQSYTQWGLPGILNASPAATGVKP